MKKIRNTLVFAAALAVAFVQLTLLGACSEHQSSGYYDSATGQVVQQAPAAAPAPVIVQQSQDHTMRDMLVGGGLGYLAGRATAPTTAPAVQHTIVERRTVYVDRTKPSPAPTPVAPPAPPKPTVSATSTFSVKPSTTGGFGATTSSSYSYKPSTSGWSSKSLSGPGSRR